MNAIILLFLLGVVLLAFEVITPGMILGILGGISMLVGCVLAFTRFGNLGGWTAVGCAGGLIGLTLVIEFWILPRTRAGRKLFLHSAVTGVSQPPPGESSVVGREAEALTTLAPTGYVDVGGKRYEAFSVDGHVSKGAKLRVLAVDQFSLKVSKLNS